MTARWRPIDECRARGCGGLLNAVGDTVHDGEITHCRDCGRMHTFVVDYEGAQPRVEPDRKPRAKRSSP